MAKAKKLELTCEAKGGKAVIRIIGRINDWQNSAEQFEQVIDQLIADGIKDVELYIRSGGGSIFEANEIYNLIKRFPGTINTEYGALAASAATYIGSAGSVRRGPKNISFMVHFGQGGVDGDAEDIESYLTLLKQKNKDLLRVYSEVTGKSEEYLAERMKNDWWMTADMAKKEGFITEIIEEAPVPEDVYTELKESETAPENMKMVAEASFKPQQKPESNMSKVIYSCLGLSEGKQTDSDAVAHIEILKAKAAKADALEVKLKETETAAAEAKANAVLDAAISKKQITPKERDFYKKNLIADFEGTKAVIESRPAVTALSAGIISEGSSEVDRSKWTYEDYQKDPDALAELHEKEPEKFEKLSNAYYGVK